MHGPGEVDHVSCSHGSSPLVNNSFVNFGRFSDSEFFDEGLARACKRSHRGSQEMALYARDPFPLFIGGLRFTHPSGIRIASTREKRVHENVKEKVPAE